MVKEVGAPAGEELAGEELAGEGLAGEPAGQEEAKVRELRRRLVALGQELQSQPHVGIATPRELPGELNPEKLTDDTLRRFLVARRWNLDKAFQMYSKFAEYRLRVPEGSIAAADVSVGLRHKKTFLLPDVGEPCFLTVMQRHIVSECPDGEAFKYTQFSFDRINNYLKKQGEEKVVFVFDFTGFGWDNLDVKTAAEILKQAQDYNPERLKKAILFNAPTLFWTLWKMITPLMDSRTQKKFKFCYNIEDLKKHFPASGVPESMGGEAPESSWVPIEDV